MPCRDSVTVKGGGGYKECYIEQVSLSVFRVGKVLSRRVPMTLANSISNTRKQVCIGPCGGHKKANLGGNML